MDPRMLTQENQFLGCVLTSPLPAARALMAGLSADEFARPMAAHIATLAMQVMGANLAPAPAALYTHAVATGQARGDHRITWLARELAELHEAAPPSVMGGHYRALVLDAAWRRRVTRYARRLLQAADTSPADVLADLLDDRPADHRAPLRTASPATGRKAA